MLSSHQEPSKVESYFKKSMMFRYMTEEMQNKWFHRVQTFWESQMEMARLLYVNYPACHADDRSSRTIGMDAGNSLKMQTYERGFDVGIFKLE